VAPLSVRAVGVTRGCGIVLALVLGPTACSTGPAAGTDAPGPAVTGTSATPGAGPAPSGTPAAEPTAGAADPPAPDGVLPAPPQREPAAVSGTADGTSSPGSSSAPAPSAAPSPSAVDGAHADAAAADVVVNKRRPLTPLGYAPPDLRLPAVATATDNGLLRPDTAAAVEKMFAAAAADGVGLLLVSGYRSFAVQESTYAYWVGRYGNADGADTVSARPGYSEHQTGLAFDIGQADGSCTLVACFAGTAAAQWAAENAADFGIILRYPPGSDGTTGFSSEPWHFRYVGKDVALAMEDSGTPTLEEHFGLPAAPSY
jgi:D-alanyl-D-alanine carboxypeptidase